MPLLQVLGLLYAGTLIENSEKRKKFIGIINDASVNIEKALNGFMGKGGVVDEPTVVSNEETTDYR